MAGLCALAVAAHLFHIAAAGDLRRGSGELPHVWTSDGAAMRRFTLGQHTTAADLSWLKMVQYVGTSQVANAQWPQLLELLQEVTDLDPEYGYAYEAGGLLLSLTGRIDESDAILEKGMEHVPDRWQLPFFAAFNHWYERGDLMRGAELLVRAAAIPGSPDYVTNLAARLSSGANQIEVAIELLSATLSEGVPEEAEEEMVRKLNELIVERDLRWLEAQLAEYFEQHGAHPPMLGTLLLIGQVERLPVAPDGSLYDYDPATGEVSSAMLPKRLHYEARLGAAQPKVAEE